MLEQHHVKKALLISYVTDKQKSLKELDLLEHCETYYVTNNCDVRKSMLVANLIANEKRSLFFFSDQQPSKQNNTAEQCDKITATIHI